MAAIKPDEGLLLAWTRATTGANAHSFATTRNAYLIYCNDGNTERVNETEEYMRRILQRLNHAQNS